MLASKYLQDRNYSARAWSKISGLRSSEINENEREYLLKIDYNLHVPKEFFDNWSKIVLALSKLAKELPQSRCRSSPNYDFRHPGSGTNAILASMVSEVDVGHPAEETIFSDQWWTDVIQKLEPTMVNDPVLVNDFLRRHLPEDKTDQIMFPHFTKQPSRAWDTLSSSPDHVGQVYDMNFSDTLKPRSAEQCKDESCAKLCLAHAAAATKSSYSTDYSPACRQVSMVKQFQHTFSPLFGFRRRPAEDNSGDPKQVHYSFNLLPSIGCLRFYSSYIKVQVVIHFLEFIVVILGLGSSATADC
ncbi:hypothetical protein A1O3_03468 [Capronia epimyces CBS 606.96]|uniref:Cyclin N-terminal domain-containing protein n=1 Tax=Capronia epimyces CBS 606.96 TaxID=1182542 RepID=W9Y135_9EURO|nr:uncharacterized protein A1O3_03468 [Capronia epimyces CBS 606.96]EXJ86517.1 hypothetical protein A1O3_03468 [Capronia epimyces CBS 606.96]